MTRLHPPASLRPLSPLETIWWTMDKVARMTVVGAAELEGDVDDVSLRAALLAAQRRHPLLSVRIVLVGDRTGRGVPWFTTQGVGEIPVQEVVVDEPEALTLDSHELRGRLEREINTRLDSSGPLVRVTLLRLRSRVRAAPDASRATLLIAFHHAIADGLSGATFLRELIAAHNGAPPLGRLPIHKGPDERLPGGGWRAWGVFARNTLEQGVRFRGEAKPLRLRSTRTVPHLERQAGLHISFLDGDETSKLVARCQNQGASVHAALSTALASAIARSEAATDSPRLLLATPVNLRRVLGWDAAEIASNSFLATTSLQSPGEGSFWQSARRFQRELRDFLHKGYLLGHAPAMTRVGAAIGWALGDDLRGAARFASWAERFQNCTSGVSNLGVVNLGAPPRSPLLAVRRFTFATSFANLAPFGLAAATAGGQLNLAFGYMRPLVGRDRANALAEETLATLRRATLQT
jgi:NRPS condensation-like uncharacterized protein